ncbi:MAG: ATP-binding protein [Kiritimatiellae bacterium]|nr:ATP-binding protein [Kiritimatiellia bacterium]
MIKRWLLDELQHKIEYRRGVHLTGARQVGKSTLAGMVSLEKCRRYTLDAKKVREVAAGDPYGFVKHVAGETLVIDEIQKVPELLDAIKIVVDRDNSKGQYLLTGSSNLHFAKTVKDSLAGRLGRIRLRPLSYGEINGKAPSFLACAFAREFKSEYADIDKRGIIEIGFTGGYPEPLEFSTSERREWFQEYLEDILDKDVKDVTEIRKIAALRSVAIWLLAHSSQFFSVDELAAKTGISKVTAENYLETLKALYLFDRIPAWSRSDYDLLGKRPKWIAGDTGMIASLLGWKTEEVYFDDLRNGKFVESWVYQQLAATADTTGGYEITHYRDNKKREIDFMVEREDGAVLGVEVKAGTVSQDDFAHLKWFAANLAKIPFTGIVLYSGKDVLRFGEGFYAVPLSALGA